jgi:hypothetical protein
MQACANAAAAKIWRELGVAGTASGLLNSDATVTSIRLADGTLLTAPAHYDQGATASIKSVVTTSKTGGGNFSTGGERNRTNVFRSFSPTTGVQFFGVLCTDSMGRQLELELGMKFAL